MKLQFHRAILFTACLLACPMLLVSQQKSISETKITQGVTESLVKDLASQVHALEQSCRQLAAIYREMAVASESDSASAREVKRQYERLAENEERAAAAADKMATYQAQLAVLTHPSPAATKHKYVAEDSAYRR